ncbi:hypothetical protein GEMRC1_003507 [Eukaryota sp. GEM-RC1]
MATLDSACQTSCFSSGIAEATSCRISPSNLSFTMADGIKVPSQGNAACMLTFCFDRLIAPQVHLKTTIPVIPGKKQFLIGCDILKKLGLLYSNSLLIRLDKEHKKILEDVSCLDHLITQPFSSPTKILNETDPPSNPITLSSTHFPVKNWFFAA